MFLSQPSQQNIREAPSKEFCSGCSTALVITFGTKNFLFSVPVYYTYRKHT